MKEENLAASRQAEIFEEIRKERNAQLAKWGDTNHPSVESVYESRSDELAGYYSIPKPKTAIIRTRMLAQMSRLTYADIAIEEMSEAVCAGTEHLRREKLVNLAAVCVAWIETIDRRGSK